MAEKCSPSRSGKLAVSSGFQDPMDFGKVTAKDNHSWNMSDNSDTEHKIKHIAIGTTLHLLSVGNQLHHETHNVTIEIRYHRRDGSEIQLLPSRPENPSGCPPGMRGHPEVYSDNEPRIRYDIPVHHDVQDREKHIAWQIQCPSPFSGQASSHRSRQETFQCKRALTSILELPSHDLERAPHHSRKHGPEYCVKGKKQLRDVATKS